MRDNEASRLDTVGELAKALCREAISQSPTDASGDPLDVMKRIVTALEGAQGRTTRLPAAEPDLVRARSWGAEQSQDAIKLMQAVVDEVAQSTGPASDEAFSATAVNEVLLTVLEALLEGQERLSTRPLVLDIACGPGVLLAAASSLIERLSGHACQTLGSDIERQAIDIAARLFALAGRPASLARADVLAEDTFPGAQAEVVVADLPFSVPASAYRPRRSDARFQYGIPPRESAPMAFVQAMAAKLRPPDEGGGLVVATVPNGILHGRSTARIRRALGDRDLLRAVIVLPTGLRRRSRINVVVLDNAKPDRWRNRVQMMDLRGLFVDSTLHRGRRLVNADGLAEISRALRNPRPSRHVRTLATSDLELQEVGVVLSRGRGTSTEQTRFTTLLPDAVVPDEWREARYGSDRIRVEERVVRRTRWDPETVIASLGTARTRSTPGLGPSRPLLASVLDFEALPVVRAGYAVAPLQRNLSGRADALVLPMDPRTDCYPADPDDPVPAGTLVLALDARLDRRFLIPWLNSPNGRRARRSAHGNQFFAYESLRSDAECMRYLDQLLVPRPEPETQDRIVSVLDLLDAARADIGELEQRMWADPNRAPEVRGELRPWVDRSVRLESWTDSLPYPLASAVWTYVSVRDDPREAYRQLLNTFEAFALFHASYLISALRRDSSLWETERPKLNELLHRQHLTFRRASFATWRITSDFLRGLFRARVFGTDNEESLRHLALLGDLDPSGAERLLGAGFSRVMERTNSMRNKWLGHAGAVPAAQARELQERLHEQLLELRGELGNGWGGLHLIRVGGSTFDGSHYTYATERLQGVRMPFEPGTFHTSLAGLVTGGLYLVSESGSALQLPGFVRMGPHPDPSGTTAYFYSSLEPGGAVRAVAYQHANQAEMRPVDPVLADLVAELDQ